MSRETEANDIADAIRADKYARKSLGRGGTRGVKTGGKKTKQHLQAVPEMSSMADSQMVNISTVCSWMTVCNRTIWRWVKNGMFPAPVKIGPRTTRWRVVDIRAHLARLNAE